LLQTYNPRGRFSDGEASFDTALVVIQSQKQQTLSLFPIIDAAHPVRRTDHPQSRIKPSILSWLFFSSLS